jgi:hypothetical protein
MTTTRSSLRSLAVKNGWVLDAAASGTDLDVFSRGERQVKVAFRATGAFQAGFLVATVIPEELWLLNFDGIIADGTLPVVKSWLKGA